MLSTERLDMLRQAKTQLLADVREKVARRHIHGQYESFTVGGGEARVLHYPSDRPHPPVYFDIHGGGFVWGMMEEGDLLCHHICEQLGFEVYALDYPLGPDVCFPTALHSLYDTIAHMRDHAERFHFDPDAMVVGGRSAGGNLAAALCLLACERDAFTFSCQVLDHPFLDLCGALPESSRYAGEGAMPYALLRELADAYADDLTNPLISPILAPTERLRALPPAVIQTCELDSLRPDGDRYAELLASAGVRTIHHCFPGAFHGFTELEGPLEIPGQNYLIAGIREILG